MKTISVPAEDDLVKALEEQADREGMSVESLVLGLLRRQLEPSPRASSRYSFVGIAHSGKGDLSARTDELLAEGADPRAGWTAPR